MKGSNFYRNPGVVQALVKKIRGVANRPMRFMEVCGTHTMSIFRYGIKGLLPREISLISGPGCPVCVTPAAQIDQMIALSLRGGVTVATFGDLVRVPGSRSSLAEARAMGAGLQVVYSPADALEMAMKDGSKTVVFLGIGFETTTPSVAATILQAARNRVRNFCVFSSHKLMPPALHALFSDSGPRVDGLLCPGHVSTIIGARAYVPVAEAYGLPCVVAGFEPVDILQGIYMLARQVAEGRNDVENAYARAVTWQGNRRARKVTARVFEPVPARWRGLGDVDASGLKIKEEFGEFDARERFSLKETEAEEPSGCKCGHVIKGMALPTSCPLFSRSCTPSRPVGPCMVSGEGTCAAYYKYGR